MTNRKVFVPVQSRGAEPKEMVLSGDRTDMVKQLISSRQQLDQIHKKVMRHDRIKSAHSNRLLLKDPTAKVSIINLALPKEKRVKKKIKKTKKCISFPEISIDSYLPPVELPEPIQETPVNFSLNEKRKTLYFDSRQKYLAIKKKLSRRVLRIQNPSQDTIVHGEIEERLPRSLRSNPNMKMWQYSGY